MEGRESFRSTLALIAKLMPEEIAFEQLQIAFEEHKTALLVDDKEKIKDSKNALVFSCVMFSTREGVQDLSLEEIIKKSQDLETGQQIVARMDGDTQIPKDGAE